MASVHFETLRRAAQIMGDDRKLAHALGVTEQLLDEWKARGKPIPDDVFLRCVDIVVGDTIRKKGEAP